MSAKGTGGCNRADWHRLEARLQILGQQLQNHGADSVTEANMQALHQMAASFQWKSLAGRA